MQAGRRRRGRASAGWSMPGAMSSGCLRPCRPIAPCARCWTGTLQRCNAGMARGRFRSSHPLAWRGTVRPDRDDQRTLRRQRHRRARHPSRRAGHLSRTANPPPACHRIGLQTPAARRQVGHVGLGASRTLAGGYDSTSSRPGLQCGRQQSEGGCRDPLFHHHMRDGCRGAWRGPRQPAHGPSFRRPGIKPPAVLEGRAFPDTHAVATQ